jgi:hypothetical protein
MEPEAKETEPARPQLPLWKRLLPLGFSMIVTVVLGMAARILFGNIKELDSLSFLAFVPLVLGFISVWISHPSERKGFIGLILIPWSATLVLFGVFLLSGLEELSCLLFLGAPFLAIGTVGAFFARWLNRKLIEKKTRNKVLAVSVLPLLVLLVERQVPRTSEIESSFDEVTISASPAEVWSQIVEVPEIAPEEYPEGFFHWMGIPRPVRSVVSAHQLGATREGHFEGGLVFDEVITDYAPQRRVAFSIAVRDASLRDRIFDQHILAGQSFRFVDAAYELEPLPDGKTLLRLSSRYQLSTHVNPYGRFWGNVLLHDFQRRLLAVIQVRCESHRAQLAGRSGIPFVKLCP